MNLKTLCAVACALLPILGCQSSIPADLAVKGPRVATVQATGFQVYTWDSAWKLKAPDATFKGDISGKHYGGPTWEAADGSKVIGTKIREHAEQGTIPWLLLAAKGHEGTTGRLSDVTYIQRLHTTGGQAPASAGKAGEEIKVPYTAEYVFYGKGAAPKKE